MLASLPPECLFVRLGFSRKTHSTKCVVHTLCRVGLHIFNLVSNCWVAGAGTRCRARTVCVHEHIVEPSRKMDAYYGRSAFLLLPL